MDSEDHREDLGLVGQMLRPMLPLKISMPIMVVSVVKEGLEAVDPMLLLMLPLKISMLIQADSEVLEDHSEPVVQMLLPMLPHRTSTRTKALADPVDLEQAVPMLLPMLQLKTSMLITDSAEATSAHKLPVPRLALPLRTKTLEVVEALETHSSEEDLQDHKLMPTQTLSLVTLAPD